ncbi:MbtH family protein [Streptomyces sp. L7]
MALWDNLNDAVFNVVVNSAGQRSLWPVERELSGGWHLTGFSGSHEACLEHIDRTSAATPLPPAPCTPSPPTPHHTARRHRGRVRDTPLGVRDFRHRTGEGTRHPRRPDRRGARPGPRHPRGTPEHRRRLGSRTGRSGVRP